MFGEVLAGHLLLDDSVYRDRTGTSRGACDEPAVSLAKEHQVALWRGLQSGNLQTTATDHCCFCAEQKAAGQDDFRKIPNGTGRYRGPHGGALAPRGEHRPADAERVRARHLHQRREDLQHLPAQGQRSAWARTPTSWSGTRATKTISAKTHHQNIDFNIFEGMTVKGCAAHTISGGKLVYKQGELRVVRGAGKHVDRPAFPSYFDAMKKQTELSAPTAVRRPS